MANDQHNRPTPWQIVKSILGGALGVQSEQTRQRDFAHGNPIVYIVGGVVFTVVFILVLVFIVRMVLKSAGA